VTFVEGTRRRARCPACGWTFYNNPVPAVTALIAWRSRLLLARRARPPYAGTWDLPGGFLEADETPEAALRRELREELGLAVRTADLVGFATERYGPRGFPVLVVIYRVGPGQGLLRAADDVSEIRWFPLTRLPLRDIGFPAMRRVVRDYARRLSDS
jgi:ADP-ribose pyrophosphatase YjhB (NUDIX family)